MPEFLSSWYGIALFLAFDAVALLLAIAILYRPIFKRLFDLLVSAVCLAVTTPLFIAVFIQYNIYKKKDGENSPIFTTKEVVGKKEKIITLKYFNGVNENGEQTKFGQWLKKSKLEKLPLLIDVFLGKISFIGVKAFCEIEAKYVEEEDKDRFLAKPGLINPLILSGDEDTDYDEMIYSDKKYAWNFGVATDVKIFFAWLLNYTRGKGKEYLGKTKEREYLLFLLEQGKISKIEFDSVKQMQA